MRQILLKTVTVLLTVAIMIMAIAPALASGESFLYAQETKGETKSTSCKYIYTANDLNRIREDLDGTYILMSDINLSSLKWTPIGTASEPFTGALLGNNHTIYGITIDLSETLIDCVGLFGYIADARISNLSVENAKINVSSSVSKGTNIGTITGVLCDSIIENCDVNANIVGETDQSTYAGGIAGGLDTHAADGANIIRGCTCNGSISVTSKTGYAKIGGIIGRCVRQIESETTKTTQLVRCANHATLIANSGKETHCAGIVGYLSSYYSSEQTVDRCYNTGSVTAHTSSSSDATYTGGIVGYCDSFNDSLTVVSNCYNTGIISGDSGSGGIVFRAYNSLNNFSAGKTVEFRNCYNVGTLKTDAKKKPICANDYRCVYSNCYYLNTTGSDYNGCSLTDTKMKSAASFSSFDFSTVWQFSGDSSYSYPVLRDVYSSYTGDISDTVLHLIFSDMTYARIPKLYIGKTVAQWLDARAFSTEPKYGYNAAEMSQPLYSSSTISRIDVYRSVGDWTILDLVDGSAGYAAAVFQKGDNIIIAYRGSEGGPQTVFAGEDWSVDMQFALFNYLNPDQFDAALQTYYKYESKGNVTLTGHSLGGALVTYVSTITKAPGYSFDGAAGHVIDLSYLYGVGNIDFTSTADMTVTNYTDPQSTSSAVADLIQHTNENLLPGVCYQTNSDCIKYYAPIFWTHQQYSNTKPSTNGKTIEFMPVAETHTPKSNWYASVDLEYLGLLLGSTGGLISGGIKSARSGGKNGSHLGRLFKTGNVYLGTAGDDEITVTGSIKSIWNVTATVTTNVIYGGDGQDSLLGGCASDILIPGSLEGDLLCGGSGSDDYLIDCNKSGYVYIADMSGNDRIVLLNAENLSSSAITSVGTSSNNEWQIFDISGKIKIYILRKTKHSFTVIDANERKLCTVDAYGKVNTSRAVSTSEEDGSKDICISGDGRLDIYASDGTLVASYETNQYGQYFEEFGIVSVVQGEEENFLAATIYDSYYAEVVGSDSVDILLIGTDEDGFVQKTTSAEGIDLSEGTASVDFVEQTVSQGDNEVAAEKTEKTTGVTVSQEEATIRVSDHVELSAMAYFADGSETTDIYWISSDPTIVQCSYDAEGNCTISASKEGEVEIYAVATDSGYTATCKVSAYCVHDYACVTREPTCTEEGADVYTCILCGDTYQGNILPAIGHCYDNWVCTTCGEPDPDAPIEEETLKFKSASLTLESDISMNFYVRDTVLEGWSEPYVVFQKALYDAEGNVIDYETEMVSDFTLKNDSSGVACHAFRFAGVTSREMGSTITATLYAYQDGKLYVGATIEYSVLKYASNMLSKTSDASLQTLLVDLLNYGAASQTYFGYNTGNLPNAALTEEQQAMATAQSPVVESCTNLIKNEGAVVSFKAASLMLEEKVTINYYLNLDNYSGAVEDLELHVNYTDASGNENVKVIDSREFEYKLYSGAYRYMANFSELYAFQMRDVCTAEVFSKATGERISNTVVYSIESYVAGKINDTNEGLVRLVLEMMKYGDSAKAFFTQSQ